MSRSRKSCTSQPLQKYVLVEWLTGTFKGTFTHNVEAEWVEDFVETEMFRETGYAIEWRVPPKPRNGWSVYTGKIHEISYDLDLLKRKEAQLKASGGGSDGESSNAGAADSTPINSPPSTPQHIGKELTSAQDLLKQLVNVLTPAAQASLQKTPDSSQADNYVKVGKSLLLPRSVYLEAQASRSPTAMTIGLIRACFSRSKLRASSYAGQSRRVNGNVVQKPSLKKYQRTQDIQDFVRSRFKISQSTFGSAVNSCTGIKANRKEQIEYIDEVSDDSDFENDFTPI